MAAGKQWIGGIHAVQELLRRDDADISELRLLKGRKGSRFEELQFQARRRGIAISEASREQMDAEVGGNHQGVAALVRERQRVNPDEGELFSLIESLDHPPLLLILDSITDPHNLGACLRSADAAGVDAVIIPKDKAVGLNATVRKVASGAAETVMLVVVTNLARCLDGLKERGVWLVGTADDAELPLFDQDLKGAIALVMGSEGSGLRRLTREKCDFLIHIPMAGAVSSLNVSVATGVTLFEAIRQRRLA